MCDTTSVDREHSVIELNCSILLGDLEKVDNSFKFEAYSKFYHRHITDILRMKNWHNDEIGHVSETPKA